MKLSGSPELLWLHLPSFTERDLVGPAGSALHPTHRARLVAGFPWWPWTVHASMLTGSSPLEHGRLTLETPVGASILDDSSGRCRSLSIEAPHRIREEFERAAADSLDLLHLQAPTEDVHDLQSWLEAFGQLQSAWDPSAPSARRGLLTGDRPRPRASVPRGVDPSSIPSHDSLERLALHERVGLWRGELDEEWRDQVLSVPGVERVLSGRGLELFGVAGDDLVAVVLGPCCHFGAGEPPVALVGLEDPPVVLGWGDPSVEPWTDAVHDYRLAATVAAILSPTSARASQRGPKAALRF